MSEGLILIVVITILCGLLAYFIRSFVLPFRAMREKLRRATAVLDQHFERATTHGENVVDLDVIERELSFDADLAHLWREFQHTLHAEHSENEVDEYGQRITLRYRQTLPAEVYFSTRSLVDVPLKTDFFRHLPGILTGVGIIATFLGLIFGLAEFDVSGDPDRVNHSVESLVGSVKSAFMASAMAISLAIVVTVYEKFSFSRLTGHVHRLQHAVDQMFDSGAGEDYLSEIARGSEQSATHLAHLKEGLVNDLKHLLDGFAERQSESTRAAAEQVGTTIAATFDAPLSAMAAAMERSLEDQQSAVHTLLDGSLSAFATRLEEVVGAKLTDAAGSIEQAANNLRAALVDAPAQVEQAATRVSGILDEIARKAEPMVASAERVADASEQLATTVEHASGTVDYALDRFNRLGDSLSGAIESSAEMSTSLNEANERAQRVASSLDASSRRLEGAGATLSDVVDSLADVASRTERDGAAQRELIAAVERAASQLGQAQSDIDGFLAGLSGALAETHETFSREINATLDRTHEAFHHNLASATERLAGTVHDFGEFLESDFKGSVDSLHREFARLAAGSNGHH